MKALVFRTLSAWLTIVQTLLPQFHRDIHIQIFTWQNLYILGRNDHNNNLTEFFQTLNLTQAQELKIQTPLCFFFKITDSQD